MLDINVRKLEMPIQYTQRHNLPLDVIAVMNRGLHNATESADYCKEMGVITRILHFYPIKKFTDLAGCLDIESFERMIRSSKTVEECEALMDLRYSQSDLKRWQTCLEEGLIPNTTGFLEFMNSPQLRLIGGRYDKKHVALVIDDWMEDGDTITGVVNDLIAIGYRQKNMFVGFKLDCCIPHMYYLPDWLYFHETLAKRVRPNN